MTVKCKDCGQVNKNDTIIYRSEDRRQLFMEGMPESPSFVCVKCGGKKIVPFDKKWQSESQLT